MKHDVQKSSKSTVDEPSVPWPPGREAPQEGPARPHTLPLCRPILACFCPCTPCNQVGLGVYRAGFLTPQCKITCRDDQFARPAPSGDNRTAPPALPGNHSPPLHAMQGLSMCTLTASTHSCSYSAACGCASASSNPSAGSSTREGCPAPARSTAAMEGGESGRPSPLAASSARAALVRTAGRPPAAHVSARIPVAAAAAPAVTSCC